MPITRGGLTLELKCLMARKAVKNVSVEQFPTTLIWTTISIEVFASSSIKWVQIPRPHIFDSNSLRIIWRVHPVELETFNSANSWPTTGYRPRVIGTSSSSWGRSRTGNDSRRREDGIGQVAAVVPGAHEAGDGQEGIGAEDRREGEEPAGGETGQALDHRDGVIDSLESRIHEIVMNFRKPKPNKYLILGSRSERT